MKRFITLKFFILSLILFITFSCEKNTQYISDLENPELFSSSVKNLQDVIVYDIFSPPAASRVYMYPILASYAVIQKQQPDIFNSLQGQLNDFNDIPEPSNKNINYELASIHAFYQVSKSLIYSEELLIEKQNQLYDSLKTHGLPNKVFKASTQYGEEVSAHILEWMDADLYKQTRSYPQYTVIDGPQFWKPTPPNYMAGIEPHWDKIRTMLLETSDQFPPKPPKEFSLEEDSPFMAELMETYEVGGSQNSKGVDIAKFWDCNPYVAIQEGHIMYADKKITPGGHWIGITGIASNKANFNFAETVDAFTNVSIALFDGFISCWDEKWNTIVVRPETLINEYIDRDWKPLLQTPPFPEYTSGHSVISAAAAVALTSLFGDNFDFIDTTEIEYGLPAREFQSFFQASEEAAISRLYGGIHYRMAIEEGYEQGLKVGNYIIENLQTKKK